MTKRVLHLASMLLLLAGATRAGATTLIYTAPAANGGGPGAVVIASWTITLGADEFVTAATFTSTFGNSVAPASAIGTLTLAGVQIAACEGPGFSCWAGPITPITYSFLPSEIPALHGAIELVYDQTDCCDIRLGEQRLVIETAIASPRVPEPLTWAMFVAGAGLVGGQLRRSASRARAAA